MENYNSDNSHNGIGDIDEFRQYMSMPSDLVLGGKSGDGPGAKDGLEAIFSDSVHTFEPSPPPVKLSHESEEDYRTKYRFDLFEEKPKRSSNTSSKAKEKKKMVPEAEIVKRIKALGITCLVLAGIVAGAAIAPELKESSIISPHLMSFSHNVVSPNTHRTYDAQNHYYDYDDISKYLTVEGEDFSRRLYIAYSVLGENQTDRVLEYVPGVNSVQSYIEENGFEDIEAWEKNEEEKFVLEYKIEKASGKLDEKKEQLDVMFADPYEPIVSKTDAMNYGGSK